MREDDGVHAAPAARAPKPGFVIRRVFATATGAAVLVLVPATAHADDEPGLLGRLVGGVTGAVGGIVDPLVDAVGGAVSGTPVVGPVLTPVIEAVGGANPVDGLTSPLTGALDGLLGPVTGQLPIVGGLVGSTPTGSLVSPVAGALDGTLSGLAPGVPSAPGVPGDPAAPGSPGSPGDGTVEPGRPGALPADAADGTAGSTDPRIAALAARLQAAASGIAPQDAQAARGTDHRDTLAPAPGPGERFSPNGPLDETPALLGGAAWTSSSTVQPSLFGELVSTAFLLVLVLGFLGAARSRAPPRPVAELDSTPD